MRAVLPVLRKAARRVGVRRIAAASILVCGGPASAEEAAPGPADLAGQLVDEVLASPAAQGPDVWLRAVMERVLPPLWDDPDSAPPRSATADVLLFTSLAVPAASWRDAARDAARIGAPLVLRGVAEGGLPATARQVLGRLGHTKVGVAIDPRLFRLFGIERVPAVVVVPGGVPPCRSPGCADDDPPPFDRVSGNLSLAAALEAVAAEGDPGRATARRHLAALRGTER